MDDYAQLDAPAEVADEGVRWPGNYRATRRWKQRNAEAVAAQQARYYARNRSRRLAYLRAWRAAQAATRAAASPVE